MSLVKTNAVQLGQSGTPTQNFTWYQPAVPDSTVRLGNGNSGSVTDVMTATSAGNVGIGTSSPLRSLDINGGLALTVNGGGARAINWIDSATGIGPVTIIGNSGATTYLTFNTNTFGNAALERMRLDSSGNLGLGVTPSAWSSLNVIQAGLGAAFFGSTANYNAYLSANGYYNGSSWIYSSNGYFGYYRISAADGSHTWLNSTSGTAGNPVTLTTAMVLDASGNLGIGTSSPTSFANYKFVTTQATTGAVYQAFGASGTDSRVFADNGYGGTGMFSNHPFLLYTNSTERMRIDTSGNVGVGTSNPATRLTVSGTFNPTTAGSVPSICSTGSYGGGLGLIDGTTTAGMYTQGNGTQLLFFSGLTSGVAALSGVKLRIDGSGYAFGTVATNSEAIMPAKQFYRLNTTLAGANATGAQKVLGVGVSLAANTQYVFEGSFYLTKAAGTTSHNVTFNFGGTAGVNNMECEFLYNVNATSLATTGATSRGVTASFAAAITVASAIVTAVEAVVVTVKGTISVSTAGTMIPQYNLSAAPGGAYTTAIGSYFSIWPVAASGANVNIGSWA